MPSTFRPIHAGVGGLRAGSRCRGDRASTAGARAREHAQVRGGCGPLCVRRLLDRRGCGNSMAGCRSDGPLLRCRVPARRGECGAACSATGWRNPAMSILRDVAGGLLKMFVDDAWLTAGILLVVSLTGLLANAGACR